MMIEVVIGVDFLKGAYTLLCMGRDAEFPQDVSLAAAQGCLGFGVRKAARAIGQLYDAALVTAELKGTQFSLLNAIHLMGAPGVQQLADQLVMDRTTLTRNLRPLEQRGLVRITPGVDRRERHVALTDPGRGKLKEALQLWEPVQARLTAALGERRVARLLEDFGALVEATRD